MWIVDGTLDAGYFGCSGDVGCRGYLNYWVPYGLITFYLSFVCCRAMVVSNIGMMSAGSATSFC